MGRLVSLIVAFYNVELFARKCMDSLIRQTYQNLEIICVDDGSTDQTSIILDEYLKKDHRVTIFHKENGGLSDARNFGLVHSSGDFVCFVDGDDFITDDYVERLVSLQMKYDSDISVLNFSKFDFDSKKIVKNYKKTITTCFDKKEALRTMLYQNMFDVSAWGKLYKKELFNDIFYPYGKLYEDNGTTYLLISKANKVSFSSYVGYYYVQRANSILSSKFNSKKMDGLELSKNMVRFIECNYSSLKKAAYCRYVSICFNLLLQTTDENVERRELKNEIKKYRIKIIFDINSRSKTRIACVLSLFGFRFFKKKGV